MAAAAAPYIAWATATATQAEQAASQARTAAAAYEAAHAATVPPVAVTANRTLQAALVATNFFGQNTAAIAATEVAYAEMWAQDATAMYGYAAAALPAVATLTPFTPAPRTTNDGGQSGQHAAVAHAAAHAAGQVAHAVTQGVSTAPGHLHSAATLSSSGTSTSTLPSTATATSTSTSTATSTPTASSGVVYINSWQAFEKQLFSPFWGIQNQNANLAVTVGDDGDAAGYTALTPRKAFLPEPALGLLGGKDPFMGMQVHATPMVAGGGNAASVGKLSVPRSWATLAKATASAEFSEPQAVAAGQRAVALQLAESAEPLAGQSPLTLPPMAGSAPQYQGNSVLRMRDDRNFRMPRPAVGG